MGGRGTIRGRRGSRRPVFPGRPVGHPGRVRNTVASGPGLRSPCDRRRRRRHPGTRLADDRAVARGLRLLQHQLHPAGDGDRAGHRATGRGGLRGAELRPPLGLDETTWPGESIELPEPYAQGFTLPGDTATPEAPAHASHGNPSWGSTARALISDVEDLLVHGRAMGTAHGMLEPQTLRHPGHTDPRRGLHGLGPDLRTRPRTPTGTHHVLTGHRSRAGGETRRGRQCSLAA